MSSPVKYVSRGVTALAPGKTLYAYPKGTKWTYKIKKTTRIATQDEQIEVSERLSAFQPTKNALACGAH